MALSDNVIRDGDAGFIGFASRLNPVTLQPGMLQDSLNMRLDRGVAQTRKGAKRLAADISTADEPLTLSFTLASDKTVTLTFSSPNATVTAVNHGYSTGNIVNIRGANQPEYNGDFAITKLTDDTFRYTVSGSPASPTGTILANKGPIVRNSYTGGIFAAGVFASQNYNNAKEYIVLAGPDRAFLWRQGEAISASNTKTYPTSGVAEIIDPTDTVSVVQAYDRLYVLREAAQTANTVWANKLLGAVAGTCTISIASPGVITRTAHSLENGVAVVFSTTGALPTGLTAGTIYYVVNRTADTFQVAATVGGTAITTSGTQSGTHTVTPVPSVVSGTTATIFVENHGYATGERIRIEGGSNAAFNEQEYDVLSTTTHSFTVTVPSGTANDTTTAATRVTRKVKPPIYWDGGSGNFVRATGGVPAGFPATYRTMRSVGWASYINNRLILPDGRDGVLISDVGNADLYDPFWNSFRLGQGGDDFIVAVHPWVDGAALVFCRKSIWLAEINQIPSTDGSSFAVETAVSNVSLLTNEIGCSARNTIATAGQYVFFLSDAGVYRLDARLDLKLRGDTKPLSDPVADLFETVDQTKVQRAFALWHNNRYLIALPTTSGGDDTNNLIVAWNALTESWEYRDTYGIGVDQILVSTYDSKRRVFNSRRVGKLWILEENEDGTDDNATSGLSGTNIIGRIKSRRFDFGELTSKRFLRSVSDVVIPNGGTVTTKVNIIDPDKDESQIGTITNGTGSDENYHLKSPVRFKAHSAELIYETTSKRPQIRSLALEAAVKSLPATLTRNEQ